MSTYRNTYCPFCRKPLEIHKRSEFYDYSRYIGIKYQRCPYCKKIYSTNKKLFSEMNNQEKSHLHTCYLFNIFFSIFSFWAIIVVILLIILGILSKLDENGTIIMRIMGLCLIPSIFLGFFVSKRNYEEIKKLNINDFKENVDEEVFSLNKDE